MAGINNQTKLMLHMNEDFIDIKGHTITENGAVNIDATQFAGGAINFNGIDQYLTVSDSPDWDFNESISTDRTIDFWVKHDSLTGAQQYFEQHEDTNNRILLQHANGIGMRFFLVVGGVISFFFDGTQITDLNWHHVALIKVQDEYAMYVDGIQTGYIQNSSIGNLTGDLFIGQKGDNTNFLNGTMDEFRYYQGNPFLASPNVGLTDTITVPISEHVSDANTKLLLHFNGNLDDDSGEGHVVTQNGSPMIIGPKFGTASACFNGLDHHLEIPSSIDWNLGTSFTIDFWAKRNNLQRGIVIMRGLSSGADNPFQIEFQADNKMLFAIQNIVGAGNQELLTSNTTIADTNWHHYACVRNGTTTEIYIDGILDNSRTVTAGAVVTPNIKVFIGVHADITGNASLNAVYYSGKLDELRVSNNIRYTSNFTPETSAHVTDANTKLLLHFDGDFEDDSGSHSVSTNGDAFVKLPKLGNGCINFDGINDDLSSVDSTDWNILANNIDTHTIDFWVKHDSLVGIQYYMTQRTDSNNRWLIDHINGTGIKVFFAVGAVIHINITGTEILDANWHHVAVIIKSNGVSKDTGMYLDGVQVGFNNTTGSGTFTAPLSIGQDGNNANRLNGNMDEIRLHKGNPFLAEPNASLTDTIAVPTSEHLVLGGTKLLIHGDGFPKDIIVPESKFGTGAFKFLGVDQSLTMSDSSDFDILANNIDTHTIDFWVKLDNVSPVGQETFFVHFESDPNKYKLIRSGTGNLNFTFGPTNVITINNLLGTSSYHHIALVVKGTGSLKEIAIYIDGVQDAWNTTSSNFNYTGLFGIATNLQGAFFPGNIDEFRIQQSNAFGANPNVGLTDTITVPTSEHVSDANTKLLLHFNGDILDSSASNHNVARNGNTDFIDVSNPIIGEPKFKDSSAVFNGIDQYLSTGDTSTFKFLHGANDITNFKWTIEGWVKLNDLTLGKVHMLTCTQVVGASAEVGMTVLLVAQASDVNIGLTIRRGISGTSVISGSVATGLYDNNWHHIAVTYDQSLANSNATFWVDGINKGTINKSGLSPSTSNPASPLTIGHETGVPTFIFNGEIDELRISDNIRYTINFTPDTTEHIDDINTKLLLHLNEDLIDYSNSTNKTNRIGANNFSNIGLPISGGLDLGIGSVDLNGIDQYLILPDSPDFDITSSFTVDCRFRLSDLTLTSPICSVGIDGTFWRLQHTDGFGWTFDCFVSSILIFSVNANVEINDNNWHHIAAIVDGSNIGIYVDGQQIAYSNAGSPVALNRELRVGVNQTNNKFFPGNIDEFRIQQSNAFGANPNVGLTDTITVPTSEHVSDANTKLLLHFNGNLDDDSSSNHISTLNVSDDHIITANGGIRVINTKFGVGVLELDGAGDYLTVPDNDDFELSSSDFTIECFFKTKNTAISQGLLSKYDTNGSPTTNNSWGLRSVSTGAQFLYSTSAGFSENVVTGIFSINNNDWNHIVCIRSGNNFGMYLNGIQVAYSDLTGITIFNGPKPLTIGAMFNISAIPNANFFNGNIDEARIYQGNPFLAFPDIGKTDTITVPTSEHVSDTNTKLLLHFNETPIIDSGTAGHTITSINNVEFAEPRFGIGNLSLDGTPSQYLSIDSETDLDFGTNDFTIEFWMKMNSFSAASNERILTKGNGAADKDPYHFVLLGSTGDLQFFSSSNGTAFDIVGSSSFGILTAKTWYHIAITRQGNTFYKFLDGNLVGTFNSTLSLQVNTQPIRLGTWGPNQAIENPDMQMDQLRISNNARYVSSFLVPITEYITDINTILLMDFNIDFSDSSGQGHIVTEVNMPKFTYSKFEKGSGSFDGSTGFLSSPDSTDWDMFSDLNNIYTVDLWFKSKNLSSTSELIAHGISPQEWEFVYNGADGGIVFNLSDTIGLLTMNSVTAGAPNGTITDLNWHHLAIIVIGDGDKFEAGIYLDGNQIEFGTTTSTANHSGNLFIGKRANNTRFLDGNLDELRIQKSNPFGASPNVGFTDTITVPISQYSLEAGAISKNTQAIIIL